MPTFNFQMAGKTWTKIYVISCTKTHSAMRYLDPFWSFLELGKQNRLKCEKLPI